MWPLCLQNGKLASMSRLYRPHTPALKLLWVTEAAPGALGGDSPTVLTRTKFVQVGPQILPFIRRLHTLTATGTPPAPSCLSANRQNAEGGGSCGAWVLPQGRG